MLLHRSIATIALCVSPLFASDWPQWRGPERTGYVPATETVPDTLPADPKVLWRVKAGEGFASPVVAGGHVLYLDHQTGIYEEPNVWVWYTS